MKRALLALFFAANTQAQPLLLQNSPHTTTDLQPLTPRQQATLWGITEPEWQRYLMLKQQERGLWSPGLDPLTTLGVEAETDTQRQYFAERLVKKESRRLEKELAFQRAYDAAWQRLYPGLTPLKIAPSGASRASVFVKEDCPACDTLLRTLLAQKRPLDIWLVGSMGDDNRVRRWALAHGIDARLVSEHNITLNHDAGRWLQTGSSKMPVVLEKRGEQWREVLP